VIRFLIPLMLFLLLLTLPAAAQDTVSINKVIDPVTFVTSTGEKITLLGVGGPATGAFTTKDLVERLTSLLRGRSVVLVRDSLVPDARSAPRLRYVFNDGELVNHMLISKGFMRADTKREYEHRDAFVAAQEEARLNHVGGWQIEGFDPNAVVMTVEPNPVREASMINYRLPVQCPVVLEIVDNEDRIVAKLVDERQIPGSHTAGFQRLTLPDGVYRARLTAGAVVVVQEMKLVGGAK
jgi:endonuclease YncB( thermonuclease family)